MSPSNKTVTLRNPNVAISIRSNSENRKSCSIWPSFSFRIANPLGINKLKTATRPRFGDFQL